MGLLIEITLLVYTKSLLLGNVYKTLPVRNPSQNMIHLTVRCIDFSCDFILHGAGGDAIPLGLTSNTFPVFLRSRCPGHAHTLPLRVDHGRWAGGGLHGAHRTLLPTPGTEHGFYDVVGRIYSFQPYIVLLSSSTNVNKS